MKYYKVHYTNTYDEINLTNFEIVDDYTQALDVLEDYNSNPYYINVYIEEVK